MSERKLDQLNRYLEGILGPLDRLGPEPMLWADQQTALLNELFELRAYADVGFRPGRGPAADVAILARLTDGRWPSVTPEVGRYLCQCLMVALDVVVKSGAFGDSRGVSMPAGLSGEALTGATLLFWCFEMDLSATEASGPDAGTA